MAHEWDHIVIGAGHNGLTAAATLAEGGSRVLVVERLPDLGGLTTSLPRVPEAPGHLLHVGAIDDMFMAGTSLAADLGLGDHGYSPIELERPYGWMGADGETLILHRDLQRTLAEIRHFSPRDARKYAEIAPVWTGWSASRSSSARSTPPRSAKSTCCGSPARSGSTGPGGRSSRRC